MAQKIILVDDFDGSEDPTIETFTFTVADRRYKMDLNATNREAFELAIQPFTEKAQLEKAKVSRAASSYSKFPPFTTVEVKKWAEENNVTVSERGRISADVLTAYFESKGKSKK